MTIVGLIQFYNKSWQLIAPKAVQSYGSEGTKTGLYATVENGRFVYREVSAASEIRLLCSMASELLRNWQKKSAERQKLYKQFIQKAEKNKVLRQLPDLHEEAFQQVDCLQCANCCKNFSPRFKTPDVKRISKHLRMKESVFIETYLNVDEEGDFVTKSHPCPFLGADNYCSIYDQRPSDCHRFPYTDEDVFIKRQNITLKNSTFCPITYYVLEKLIAAEKGK